MLGIELQSSSGAAIALVLARVSIAGIKQHDEKQLGDRWVYFILQLKVHPSLREARAGTKAEAMACST